VVDLKEKQTTNLKLVVTFLFHHNQKQIIFASGCDGVSQPRWLARK